MADPDERTPAERIDATRGAARSLMFLLEAKPRRRSGTRRTARQSSCVPRPRRVHDKRLASKHCRAPWCTASCGGADHGYCLQIIPSTETDLDQRHYGRRPRSQLPTPKVLQMMGYVCYTCTCSSRNSLLLSRSREYGNASTIETLACWLSRENWHLPACDCRID
jgi:hypothetical protein